eukprot:scaffold431_cov334-Pavlova_lutheri.AAC.100
MDGAGSQREGIPHRGLESGIEQPHETLFQRPRLGRRSKRSRKFCENSDANVHEHPKTIETDTL